MKNPFNTDIASAFLALLSWSATIVMLFVVAVPFRWLWNFAITPMGLKPLDYWHAVGVLLVWFVLEIARSAVKLSATLNQL